MSHAVEEVITGLEEGRLTRRQAVAGLTALVAAALGAPRTLAQKKPLPSSFVSRGLNHIALRVTDIDRSVEFYQRHLGLGVLQKGSRNSFLSCGQNNFVGLFRRKKRDWITTVSRSRITTPRLS